jgi:ArsR family transcriptional regulator
MKKIINFFKILSDENRLRILFMLKQKNLCVCEILELLNISGATLSSHLKILKLSGIVEQKKEGRWIEYALIDKNIIKFLDNIEDFIEDKTKIIDDNKKIKSLNKREFIYKKK